MKSEKKPKRNMITNKTTIVLNPTVSLSPCSLKVT